jgi:phosphomannomutase
MHGVGNKPVMRALQDIGLTNNCISVVTEQKDPDPEFPTVSFPNPEEHGQNSMHMTGFSSKQSNRCIGGSMETR